MVTFGTPPMKIYTREEVIEALTGFDGDPREEFVQYLMKPFRFIAPGIAISNFNANHRIECFYESVHYGVADSPSQALTRDAYLKANPDTCVVVFFTPICREDEPEHGGWRWYKWGEYVGDQGPKCEYLYDDKHIDMVYAYHIYTFDSTCAKESLSITDVLMAIDSFDLSQLD